jgi:predicted phosphodiesterase
MSSQGEDDRLERAALAAWDVDTFKELADFLEIPTSTLRDVLVREMPKGYWNVGNSWLERLKQYAVEFGYAPQHIMEVKGFLKGKTQFASTGANTAELSHRGQLHTLQQVLDTCEVDLSVWKVRDWEIKPWGVFAKRERTHLEYTGGKADGVVEKGGLETATLWSVKVRFLRREPLPIFPVIENVTCPVTFKAPKLPKKGILRGLVIPDPHMWFKRRANDAALTPLHDRRALDIALQIAIAGEVDRVDFIGDIFDLAEWTDKFLRLPEFKGSTQPTILEGHWWLRQFREARPGAAIFLYEGNHERRMARMLVSHLEAAHDLRAANELELPPVLSIPKLLALHELGITWVDQYPDELSWLNKRFALCHGDVARKAPGSTARAIAEQYNAHVIFGHIHRRESVTLTRHLPRIVSAAYCPGCTCHLDGRVPGTKGRQNWQQGIAVVDYEQDGEAGTVTTIEINEGKAIWNKALYTGRDRVDDLRVDLPRWNWQ